MRHPGGKSSPAPSNTSSPVSTRQVATGVAVPRLNMPSNRNPSASSRVTNNHGRQGYAAPPSPNDAASSSSNGGSSAVYSRGGSQGDGNQDLGPYSHLPKGSMGNMNRQTSRVRGVSNSSASSTLHNGRQPKWASESQKASLRGRGTAEDTNRDYNVTAYPGAMDLYYDDKSVDADDYLHNPDGKGDKAAFTLMSVRGLANALVLGLVFAGIIALFAGYPIIHYFATKSTDTSIVNSTGQVGSFVSTFASLIDSDTPTDGQTWTHPLTGDTYHLVFSDEFNEEGRTFWPGDDPFWEAVDLWYGVTSDLEWYSPEAINTTDGHLQISMTQDITHNLWFQSGMLQSWNKFCFTGGYIEFSAMLPGDVDTAGWWPGLWTMGNLGRPGYPATTDGMWPYSYDACDTGILPNQTYLNGSGPEVVLNPTGTFSKVKHLSYLPGMRTSACTCEGQDHPGPNVNVGRSSPEIDILEAQTTSGKGYASQSLQVAPFDANYAWVNTTPAAYVYDEDKSSFNDYTGGVYQEAISTLTQIPSSAYENSADPRFVTFGMEYVPGASGSITWFVDGTASWSVNSSVAPASSEIDISQRLIPVEPMSIIMNLGMSEGFETIQWDTLSFPAKLRIDYVRVFQLDGQDDNVTCDPDDYPTAEYIANHADIYANMNLTTYPTDGYTWPTNQLTGC